MESIMGWKCLEFVMGWMRLDKVKLKEKVKGTVDWKYQVWIDLHKAKYSASVGWGPTTSEDSAWRGRIWIVVASELKGLTYNCKLPSNFLKNPSFYYKNLYITFPIPNQMLKAPYKTPKFVKVNSKNMKVKTFSLDKVDLFLSMQKL